MCDILIVHSCKELMVRLAITVDSSIARKTNTTACKTRTPSFTTVSTGRIVFHFDSKAKVNCRWKVYPQIISNFFIHGHEGGNIFYVSPNGNLVILVVVNTWEGDLPSKQNTHGFVWIHKLALSVLSKNFECVWRNFLWSSHVVCIWKQDKWVLNWWVHTEVWWSC